jgi:hypothetical protein
MRCAERQRKHCVTPATAPKSMIRLPNRFHARHRKRSRSGRGKSFLEARIAIRLNAALRDRLMLGCLLDDSSATLIPSNNVEIQAREPEVANPTKRAGWKVLSTCHLLRVRTRRASAIPFPMEAVSRPMASQSRRHCGPVRGATRTCSPVPGISRCTDTATPRAMPNPCSSR